MRFKLSNNESYDKISLKKNGWFQLKKIREGEYIMADNFTKTVKDSLDHLFDFVDDSIHDFITFMDEESERTSAPSVADGTDPDLNDQWHIQNNYRSIHGHSIDLNVQSVWDDYTGKGVTVGIIDDGVAYNHPDLDDNYDHSLDYDARDKDNDANVAAPDDSHGTNVAGVIAAEQGNGHGGTGVAPDATIAGFRMGYGKDGSFQQEIDLLKKQVNVDISNNSWGYGSFFYDNFETANFQQQANAIQNAVIQGRDGLGTVFVFAAGNDGDKGDNANYHSYNTSPYTIAVGAIDYKGDAASFTSPGSSVLISAPGVGVYTTDRPDGDNNPNNDYSAVNGTSFAAPAVSGVIALMLEANPDLGYRDVQEILAYSARKPVLDDTGWITNGASNWNGGGLTAHDAYGYGMADAHAAVRLAETWDTKKTWWNEYYTSSSSGNIKLHIPDKTEFTDTLNVATNIEIDHVEVKLDIDHTHIGDLTIILTSPDGTESVLVDRPGVHDTNKYGSHIDDIKFTVSSTQFWGENSAGDWKLTVKDAEYGDRGILNSWSINVRGDVASHNDTYIYTDEYNTIVWDDTARQNLNDASGTDTINASAVTSDSWININAGSYNYVAGGQFKIGDNTTIENVYGGDGNDNIYGNSENNILNGGRGNDTISGGDGLDVIFGGRGDDNLYGGQGADRFIFEQKQNGNDTIHDFETGQGGDVIDLSKWSDVSSSDALTKGLVEAIQSGDNTVIVAYTSSDNSAQFKTVATLKGVNAQELTDDNFIY